jgi:hypothetical protein
MRTTLVSRGEEILEHPIRAEQNQTTFRNRAYRVVDASRAFVTASAKSSASGLSATTSSIATFAAWSR